MDIQYKILTNLRFTTSQVTIGVYDFVSGCMRRVPTISAMLTCLFGEAKLYSWTFLSVLKKGDIQNKHIHEKKADGKKQNRP